MYSLGVTVGPIALLTGHVFRVDWGRGASDCALPVMRNAEQREEWLVMTESGHEAHVEHRGEATLYRTPREAMEAPPEKLAYIALLDPDAIAVVDVDPASASYGSMVGRWDPPPQDAPDEFHHYGWNICSSALGGDHDHDGAMERRYLVVPGIRSSRIYVLDTGVDPRRPTLVRTIEPEEVMGRGHYSRPHTVHCGPEGLLVSALGSGSAEGATTARPASSRWTTPFQRHWSVGDRSRQPVLRV